MYWERYCRCSVKHSAVTVTVMTNIVSRDALQVQCIVGKRIKPVCFLYIIVQILIFVSYVVSWLLSFFLRRKDATSGKENLDKLLAGKLFG